MNIKEAKTQIKNAMITYFSKDVYGNYEIPVEKQRPIFLVGAPGIGKTAIMQQIADELDVGLVSYSMTHHTRQSALGLPVICRETFGDETFEISRYTMSEIIASVYTVIERTGKKEGILFLDEINCVSETLAPSMLLFLQYKIFGSHHVPEGWIVVTAGNPPEYNRSVRNFDIVTLDRLKVIDVEPDYKVWREYAAQALVHPAILTYLDIKKDNFYRIESSAAGKFFVTARGWEDLSKMLRLYEKKHLDVDKNLIRQYIHFDSIARDFAVYYDLFHKYRKEYDIESIFSGQVSEESLRQCHSSKFDERIALLGLIMDILSEKAKEIQADKQCMLKVMTILKDANASLNGDVHSFSSAILSALDTLSEKINHNKQEGLHNDHTLLLQKQQHILTEYLKKIPDGIFEEYKKCFNDDIIALKRKVAKLDQALENTFSFYDQAYPTGKEVLLLVTELTVNAYTSSYISEYGCDAYFAHNKELLFSERGKEITDKLNKLESNYEQI